ncbi:AAA family ATPase [Methanobrevibacter sp.]|uniref:AAA family ATPase n=1 Tax=Methanobrevibacter sp. TaxID=66852 RepID=UPI002E76DC12|nr:AAA family ATPase [Methanobrevibacter sp.]MEE0025154.1 AAA family ATPase [Methanobrevibacter sp.]
MNNKLLIKNFGPIKKADITISPLTIFIGPNSSGKSYSALLIHSILNSFNNLGLNLYELIRQDSVKRFLKNDDDISEEFKNSLTKYVNSKPKFSDEPFKFPTDKFKIILERSFGQVFNELVEEKLKGNFSNNLNKLNQQNNHPFEFSFNNNEFINKNGNLFLKKYYVNMNQIKNEGLSDEEDNNNISEFEIDEEYLSIKLDYIIWHNFFNKDEFFIEVIFMMVVSSVMDTLNQTSYYIPAAGDELFKDVNNFIANDIQGAFKPSIVQKELLTNFLKVKTDMDQSPFYNLANELEHEILGGELQVKQGEIKEELLFIDNEYNMEFELELTSSSVRELTPLIIYFKYFLKEGNTLIIEEPENHLHPKNQLILVKYLVKAINQGLNIIITTHSDYIVEKFNNFIRLGNANDEIFDKLHYDDSHVLNYENVSIYNFKKENKYSYVAESLAINNTGFDENSFNEVNNELYDESVDIIDAEKR